MWNLALFLGGLLLLWSTPFVSSYLNVFINQKEMKKLMGESTNNWDTVKISWVKSAWKYCRYFLVYFPPHKTWENIAISLCPIWLPFSFWCHKIQSKDFTASSNTSTPDQIAILFAQSENPQKVYHYNFSWRIKIMVNWTWAIPQMTIKL